MHVNAIMRVLLGGVNLLLQIINTPKYKNLQSYTCLGSKYQDV